MNRSIAMIPKFILGFLVLSAIVVMLAGVFLRYIMLPITDWMDVDPVNFFWVEEVGELALTWLVMIGAALGVRENSHFYLSVFVHKLPSGMQKCMVVFNYFLIAAFGGLIAWICFGLAMINKGLASPALEMSLGLFYISATVGGILMVLIAGGCVKDELSNKQNQAITNLPDGH